MSVMTSDAIADRVASLSWYHTFDLDGVVTPGMFDHRSITSKLLIPDRLDGLRCLDAASADGFFAFELKRRGAAEVISLDAESMDAQDWQGSPEVVRPEFDMAELRERFDLVNEVTGLGVERVRGNLYDISPGRLGSFDLVFIGNILLHLRNPSAALHALRSVTKGDLISYEPVSFVLSAAHPWTPAATLWNGAAGPYWWTHNIAGHRHLLRASGFEILESRAPVLQPYGQGTTAAPRRFSRRSDRIAYWLWNRWFGLPSSVVRARPDAASPP
jgi:hypothetical protein